MNEHLIALFEKQLRDDPKSRVFLRLAEEYRKGGEFLKGAAVCQKGLSVHPSYVPALVCLGRCLVPAQDLGGAETTFRKVLDLNADNPHALQGLGEICVQTGRNEDALKYFETLLIHDPGNEAVFEKVGNLKADRFSPVSISDVSEELLDEHSQTGSLDLPHTPIAVISNMDAFDNISFDMLGDDEISEDSDDELILDDESDEDQDLQVAVPLPGTPFDEDITLDLSDEEELNLQEVDFKEAGSPDEESAIDLSGAASQENSESTFKESIDQSRSGSELDDIDLEFEKAMSDETVPKLFQETDTIMTLSTNEPPKSGSGEILQSGLTSGDEILLTQGLKHEHLEHYEETRDIYSNLLHKYPGNQIIMRHLERVTRLLSREGHKAKKIRHLSNWLDKVKGAYYVS